MGAIVVVDWARSALELLLTPLDALPPWASVSTISLVTAVVALLAVKYTTNQAKVERARDLMTSTIYEMRLFIDSPRRVLLAQARLLIWSMLYTGRTLPALALLILPLGLLYLHLELRHSYLPVDGRALVTVEMAEGASPRGVTLELEGPGEVLGPVVDPADRKAYFRVDLEEPRAARLRIRAGEVVEEKAVVANRDAARISPERLRGWVGLIALGYEPALPGNGPFERISVDHVFRERSILWMPWWLTWMLLAILFAFALRKPLGVVI